MSLAQSESPSPTDLRPAFARSLRQFEATQASWAESVVQTCLEAAHRMSWWRQVRAGVHVPIRGMYLRPVVRLADLEARRFVHRQSIALADGLGLSVPGLRFAGQGALGIPEGVEGPLDPVVRRLWTEGELEWRRRLERTVRQLVAARGTRLATDRLEGTLRNVAGEWQRLLREPSSHHC